MENLLTTNFVGYHNVSFKVYRRHINALKVVTSLQLCSMPSGRSNKSFTTCNMDRNVYKYFCNFKWVLAVGGQSTLRGPLLHDFWQARVQDRRVGAETAAAPAGKRYAVRKHWIEFNIVKPVNLEHSNHLTMGDPVMKRDRKWNKTEYGASRLSNLLRKN